VVRVREGGEIVDEISTGDDGAYACVLGGDDGKTLFICVAPGFNSEERKASTEGRMVSVRVEVPHAGLP
jgi:sugar lactone lactonase YvrE